MRRHVVTARGVTVSFLMDELAKYDDALGALVESKDGLGEFTDTHMETVTSLYTKIRTAILVATEGETLRRETRERLTYDCDLDAE
jgi:hypothetical protein